MEFQKVIIKMDFLIFSKYEAIEYTLGFPFDFTAGKIEKIANDKFIKFYGCDDRDVNVRNKLEYKNYDDVFEMLKKNDDAGYFKLYLESLKEFFGMSIDLDYILSVWNQEHNARRTLALYKRIYR